MHHFVRQTDAFAPKMTMNCLQRLVPFWLLLQTVTGCTNLLVTPGATEDGSAILAYNSDDVTFYGFLDHYPPTQGEGGESMKVYDWETGVYMGKIPQVNRTYNVIGNANERGLVIGETTFGGAKLGKQKDAILDYGSLIYLTLQRAETAREAIQIMTDLMDTHGYTSEGESFSFADASGEVWIMDTIGRGDSYGKLGAVWVARRVPDGMIAAHANQARITTFPRDDPENCLYAEDVVDVAVHYGLYSAKQDPLKFSFSDTYNPMTVMNARWSEARVWDFFSQVADKDGLFEEKFQDYAAGRELTIRMPLFVKPYRKLSVFDVMNMMNSHFEGTEFDGTQDVGAGMWGNPYRPRPLGWKYEDKSYFNERTVAVERTGWNFVAQIRTNMPPELSALLWFACDDSSTSPRVPVYASSTKVAAPYAGKRNHDCSSPPPILTFDLTKAFWLQNMVSNFVYWRWSDAYPLLRQKIDLLHFSFVEQVKATDGTALKLYEEEGPDSAVDFVTDFSIKAAEDLHETWMDVYSEFFSRFRDFSTIVPDEDNDSCGCVVQEPGIAEHVKRQIVMETGTHYEVVEDHQSKPHHEDTATLQRTKPFCAFGETEISPTLSHIIRSLA